MRVYVETTVWSFAFAEDSPDLRAMTERFFDLCRSRVIQPVVSPLVAFELSNTSEGRREGLLGLLVEIKPEVVPVTGPALQLAEAFIRHGAVPPSKPLDARHVAVAFCESVETLVSWNFKHIANVRRAERFNAIAVLLGRRNPVRILNPAEVLYGTDSNESA